MTRHAMRKVRDLMLLTAQALDEAIEDRGTPGGSWAGDDAVNGSSDHTDRATGGSSSTADQAHMMAVREW